MQKKSYKDILKKYGRGVVYIAVLMAITVGSVMSVLSMRKNIVSSINEDTQKIFSSGSETLENVVTNGEEKTCNVNLEDNKKLEPSIEINKEKEEEKVQ